jgi:DNA processing protein
MSENLKYWLALNKIPGLGPVTIKKLWEHFGDVKLIWQAGENKLLDLAEINRPALKSFLENRDKLNLDGEIEKTQKTGVKTLTLEDKDYPLGLKNIYDPPPVLYLKGGILAADQKSVAIVGTRKASHYGQQLARKFAFELASLGITIVSGLAQGIDTCAHQGALAAKGRTLAVFGCGVDIIFPFENRRLAEQIELSGALISEFPLGARVEKGNFPRRNRIISGLALGTIVIEGNYNSGAMITAGQALEQGREVFAVPGNVELEQSKGPHWLIKQGAKLVEKVEDVLEELKFQLPAPKKEMAKHPLPPVTLSPQEQKIVSVISAEPKHLDLVSIDCDLSTPQVSSLLMQLEIKKTVRQLPGKMFALY